MTRRHWLALTLLLCGQSAFAQGAVSPDDGNTVALLLASDILHDQAVATNDPVLLIGALALTAKVRGRVFSPGGQPADISYGERWAEAERAVRGDARLTASFATLPTPDRGATSGAWSRTVAVPPGGIWRGTIRYDGGQPAALYARSTDRKPLRLTVSDGRRTVICDRTDPTGRSLCGWQPARSATFAITVSMIGGGAANRTFQLITN